MILKELLTAASSTWAAPLKPAPEALGAFSARLVGDVPDDGQRARLVSETLAALGRFLSCEIMLKQVRADLTKFVNVVERGRDPMEAAGKLSPDALDAMKLAFVGLPQSIDDIAAEGAREDEWLSGAAFANSGTAVSVAKVARKSLTSGGPDADEPARMTARYLAGVWRDVTGRAPSVSRTDGLGRLDGRAFGAFTRFMNSAAELLPDDAATRLSAGNMIRHGSEFILKEEIGRTKKPDLCP